jgi:hypothetical protein
VLRENANYGCDSEHNRVYRNVRYNSVNLLVLIRATQRLLPLLY